MKYHGKRLGELLMKEGLCPEHASNVELHIATDGAVRLRYDVLFDSEHIPKLVRALERLLEPPPAPLHFEDPPIAVLED